ncbi:MULTISPECIES: single-stranded-DNA-specific exonuclease RecJ [Thermoanaerobacterium]|uniref:Single-stranded-DNA-specific exonuclease RecJ n=2 Tax=Thermoanaerobacterium TaxID=28895 RepID=W9EB89_9THEO|nr:MULTISPECIES: single-stranded-DNA-specific exonuclease RecJ [Thermoanaerobacterium]AFK86700.1 single-stranded-DNA-specific exonuclease RecJ [Thermoanaerobacterium saccharolyticum JW/SL-YS485]ETO38285.1 single-stranded-DNA-specific exonuclease RecJ [Thermoanaerobacterium aotearoense SCUT27]
MIYNWVSKKIKDDKLVQEIAIKFNLKTYVAQTIVNRGYDDLEKVYEYLNPTLNALNNPYLLEGIEKAVSIIKYHVGLNNKITIYGDYDVDGITSTSILYMTLKRLGANVDFYIPDRLLEGYGINMDAVKTLCDSGTKLIITVDCGIASLKEVQYARNLGLDIIVTDHHQVPDVLPEANCIVNPHIKDCTYPYIELAGVGVTFKLCLALLGDEALEFLDIVALGTVADIVPLTGENRVIVKEGLKMMRHTKNKGLRALINSVGLNEKDIDTYHVGFILAPRLNAAGRLESAVLCVNLLVTDNPVEADRIAAYLNSENAKRQEIEKKILEEAIMKVENDVDLEKEKVIVLYSENWHPGVIGIVSSRITESYHRPSILISLSDGFGKGSGRSIKGFNIYEAIKYAGDCLINFGGHEMAAGLTIDSSKIDDFKLKINEYAKTKLTSFDMMPIIEVETSIDDVLDLEGANQISLLEPFGSGNPMPMYVIKNLVAKQIFLFGDNKHVRIMAEKNDAMYNIVLFNRACEFDKISAGAVLDIAGFAKINEWNGEKKLEIIAKDVLVKEKNVLFFRNLYNTLIGFNDDFRGLESYNFIDARNIDDKRSYVLKLFKNDDSTAVIINTRYHIKEIINYLNACNYYNFKLSNKIVDAKNAVLWCVNADEIMQLLSKYKNIVFYDIPFDSKMFYNILANNRGSVVHLLFGKKDLKSSLNDICNIVPRRSDFAKVFLSIKENSDTLLLRDQIYDYFNLNSIKSMICLKILKDNGLINIEESDNIFVLRRNSVDSKVDIKDHQLLKKLYMAEKSFIKFAFQILKKNVKEETA